VAGSFTRHIDVDIGPRGIATGGTTYASALAAAVARVVLEKVMTADAYARVRPRSGCCLEPLKDTRPATPTMGN
jgi:hypothetical protein